jgi:HAE1 family hydrophobic/amphiphilic exporter-1
LRRFNWCCRTSLEDAVLQKAAEKELQNPGATGVKLSVETGNPEINVKVDRDKMAALGLSLQTVGMTMQTAYSGNTDGKFRAGDMNTISTSSIAVSIEKVLMM